MSDMQDRIPGSDDTVTLTIKSAASKLDTLVTLMEDRIRKITDLHVLWDKRTNVETDTHTIGMYNGIELALATIQGREPRYKNRRN